MMIGALIEMPKVSTPISKQEVNEALEEFKKEEESVFPPVEESLIEFLSKK